MHSAGEANRGQEKRHLIRYAAETYRDREPYAIAARQPTKLTAMQLDSQIAIK